MVKQVEDKLNEDLDVVAKTKFEAHEQELEKKKRYNWKTFNNNKFSKFIEIIRFS